MRITGQMEIPYSQLTCSSLRYHSRAIRRLLDTLEISYDKNRINGKKLLEWEAKSNLDVQESLRSYLNESSL